MIPAKWLAHVSLAAGVVFTATAEYSLARRLGAQEPVAVMLPVAIDAYAIAALKRFRAFDIALSLLLMCAAQVSAHLLDSHVMPVNGWLVVVVSLLVPAAIWRTHALARDEDETPVPAPVEYTEAPTVERVPEAYPAIEAPVPAATEAVPADVETEAPRNENPTPALAAEETRTRSEVHAEYVPEPASVATTQVELDEAALLFKDELLAGKIPGIARIKSECRVGQDKAKQIQDGLRQAQVAWSLAGQGATS
jgi:hypothetical protein